MFKKIFLSLCLIILLFTNVKAENKIIKTLVNDGVPERLLKEEIIIDDFNYFGENCINLKIYTFLKIGEIWKQINTEYKQFENNEEDIKKLKNEIPEPTLSKVLNHWNKK